MMYNMVTSFKKLFFMLQKSPLPTTKNSFQNDKETLLWIWRTSDGQRASELRSQDNIWKRIKSKSLLQL